MNSGKHLLSGFIVGVQGQGDVDIRCVLPLRGEKTWAWEGRSHVMGILNITPDSFSDGGQFTSVHQVLQLTTSVTTACFSRMQRAQQGTWDFAGLVA